MFSLNIFSEDVVFPNSQNREIIFTLGQQTLGNSRTFGLAIKDIDLDGDFDLIVTHPDIGNLLLMNDGSGNFTSLGEVFGYSPVIRIECDDLDGDNDYDVVFGQGENTGGNPIYFNESTAVDVNINTILPQIRSQNYPNPFNPSTTISFNLSAKDAKGAKLEIYNLKGQKIKTFPVILNGAKGQSSVVWNGTDQSNNPVASGIYYFKLNLPNSPIKKMLLIK